MQTQSGRRAGARSAPEAAPSGACQPSRTRPRRVLRRLSTTLSGWRRAVAPAQSGQEQARPRPHPPPPGACSPLRGPPGRARFCAAAGAVAPTATLPSGRGREGPTQDRSADVRAGEPRAPRTSDFETVGAGPGGLGRAALAEATALRGAVLPRQPPRRRCPIIALRQWDSGWCARRWFFAAPLPGPLQATPYVWARTQADPCTTKPRLLSLDLAA